MSNTSSSAGYVYPTMWLMENYDGKKISDLSNVTPSVGYADAFAQAAAEQFDIIVCYADGRRDYEKAWNLPTDSKDETGKAGMGRTDSIWNELNVIGVTEPSTTTPLRSPRRTPMCTTPSSSPRCRSL